MNEPKKLTPMHWAVYRAVLASSEYGYPITQKDLCEAVGLPYSPMPTNCLNPKKGDHCRQILTYVHDINVSTEVDKIIVCDRYTYRIGTEQEVNAYYDKLHKNAIKSLQRLNWMAFKMKRNNQYKLINNQGKEIKDGNEQYHEAFR